MILGLEELKRLGIPVTLPFQGASREGNQKNAGPAPAKKMVRIEVSVPVWNDIEVVFEVPEGTDDDEIRDLAIAQAEKDEPLTAWLVDEDRDMTANINGETRTI
jgi:hypothetical protein